MNVNIRTAFGVRGGKTNANNMEIFIADCLC